VREAVVLSAVGCVAGPAVLGAGRYDTARACPVEWSDAMARESESDEQWWGDLEADQLERLEGREAESDHPAVDDFVQPGTSGPTVRSSRSPAVFNEQWEGDLEADQLDRLAADEAAEDRPAWEQ